MMLEQPDCILFVIKQSNEVTLKNAKIIEWKKKTSKRPRRHNSAAPLPNLFSEIEGNSNNAGQALRYFCGTHWAYDIMMKSHGSAFKS